MREKKQRRNNYQINNKPYTTNYLSGSYQWQNLELHREEISTIGWMF